MIGVNPTARGIRACLVTVLAQAAEGPADARQQIRPWCSKSDAWGSCLRHGSSATLAMNHDFSFELQEPYGFLLLPWCYVLPYSFDIYVDC